MPDVVLSRQQQAHNSKNATVKTENSNANGEDGGEYFISKILLLIVIFSPRILLLYYVAF